MPKSHKKYMLLIAFALKAIFIYGQLPANQIDSLNLEDFPAGSISDVWLNLGTSYDGLPEQIPLIIMNGSKPGPVLGITAAIHGNELNGVAIIHELSGLIDLKQLSGTIVLVPVLNMEGMGSNSRYFIDGADLNRLFPGKSNGNRSQQYVWHLDSKLLPSLDFLIDLHTASFGRINSFYIRADLDHPIMNQMAQSFPADIILRSKGEASTASQQQSTMTMRASAMQKGIPSITVECGDPQIYQKDMIQRGVAGIWNTMIQLDMLEGRISTFPEPIQCAKSYWIYTDHGGFLEIPVGLNQKVRKGEVIGVLKDVFGLVIKTYYCPEDGIVIGKSTNPINRSGGRIIHLGLIEN